MKLSKAERKERAKQKKILYGNIIIDKIFEYVKSYDVDYSYTLINRFIEKLIKENPQEAELIRASVYSVTDSMKMFSEYVEGLKEEKTTEPIIKEGLYV